MSHRPLRAVTILLLALLVAGKTRANPIEFKAAPESAKLGVGKYVVERTGGNTLSIQVLDGQGAEKLTISAILYTSDGARLALKTGKEDLTVTLNFDTGRLSLKDNLTGESAAATPGQPLRNEGSSILLDAHSETVSLAVVAFEENLTNLGIPRSSPGRRSGAAPPLLFSMQPAQPGSPGEEKSLILKDSPGNCSGVIITGNGFGSSQAIACANATQNNNNSCTNGFCYGCCQFLLPPNEKSPCTCKCLTQYWCSCTTDGQACGSTWDSTPGSGSGSGDGDGDGGGSGDGGGTGGGGGGGCRLESGVCSAACFSCSPTD